MLFFQKMDRKILSWCSYDVGNSAFATTIMAAIYPVYYKEVASLGLAPNLSTAYWAYASAISLFASAFFAPVIGAAADIRGSKKKMLLLFTLLGVFSSGAMAFVGPGDWRIALILLGAGNIGFTASIIFYDALLPSLAPPNRLDMISAQGYALGYLGGGVLLAINLLFIALLPGTAGARLSFLSVAFWWAFFTLPILLYVEEPPPHSEGRKLSTPALFIEGLKRLESTFRDISHYKNAFVFLLAFWFYNDGIGSIIRMAAIYGASLGIPMSHLAGALLVTQFVGIPFSLAFGRLASAVGSKSSITAGLTFYLIITLAAIFVREAWHFWALAIAVGMVQGGVQAISRSFFASMIPQGKNAEFFGFYDISSKFSGILGPAIFGLIVHWTGSNQLAVAVLSYTFIVGIIILRKVRS